MYRVSAYYHEKMFKIYMTQIINYFTIPTFQMDNDWLGINTPFIIVSWIKSLTYSLDVLFVYKNCKLFYIFINKKN